MFDAIFCARNLMISKINLFGRRRCRHYKRYYFKRLLAIIIKIVFKAYEIQAEKANIKAIHKPNLKIITVTLTVS